MDNKKTYCLKEKKLTGNYDSKTITLSNGKIILSRCSNCGKKSLYLLRQSNLASSKLEICSQICNPILII